MESLLGKRLDGRYQIEELVGEGGMADVYRGTDLSVARPVAIKILRPEFYGNEELVRRFMNESRAISVLNHPNIVKVYDVSVTDKVHYIVMELLQGITLKEYIEQRGEPLTYKEVVHFISQVLPALQHAHDRGIVHRDIKPQNIMILEDGSIRVMDFGIARLARSEIHTAEEQAIGSVHYISPEQAQGAETDMRADIYSLGIMMYEMLSGRLPFEDESAVAIAVKHISDEAVPLGEVNPSVPQGLVDITTKAMSKNPKNRYPSALVMLRDIEEFKRNPSIQFEYEYLDAEQPARIVSKAMANGKPAPRKSPQKAAGKAKRDTTRARNKRKRKISLLVPIFLGLTLAVVGICAVYGWDLLQNSSNPLFGNYEDIELPDFTGLQYNEVEALAKAEPLTHLRLRPTEQYDPDVPAGTILSQRPSSNDTNRRIVKANQVVTLVISSGAETVEVPDISGMSRAEAIRAVLDKGLMPYARWTRVDGVPAGTAIRTQPEAGTPVKNEPGTVITIFIASNVESYERVVPDLLGLESLVAAQEQLKLRDLQIGQIIEVESTEPAGTILSQYPNSGTVVKVATAVHVTVAKEIPPPPPDPTPPPVSSSAPPPASSSDSTSTPTSEDSTSTGGEGPSEGTSESTETSGTT